MTTLRSQNLKYPLLFSFEHKSTGFIASKQSKVGYAVLRKAKDEFYIAVIGNGQSVLLKNVYASYYLACQDVDMELLFCGDLIGIEEHLYNLQPKQASPLKRAFAAKHSVPIGKWAPSEDFLNSDKNYYETHDVHY